jgi:hypothetical protein
MRDIDMSLEAIHFMIGVHGSDSRTLAWRSSSQSEASKEEVMRPLTSWLLVAFFAFSATPGGAGEKDASARCGEVRGILLAKTGAGWRALEKGQPAPVDVSLIALPAATLLSADGAVSLELKADIGNRGPLPVLESAVVLNKSTEHALDVTLERGIIVFKNLKEGDARVRLRLRGEPWDLTLRPGARVGLELYARYAAGVISDFDKKIEEPCAQVVCLVLEGRAFLTAGDEGFALQAPPGLALGHWDNLERKLALSRLDKIPEFIRPMTPAEKDVFDKAGAAAATLSARDKSASLRALLGKDDLVARKTGVVCAGALDEIPILLECLEDAKEHEVRTQAIVVLRHYLGRGPKEVGDVYRTLIDSKLTKVQASLFLELAFGFTPEQREEPATFDVLIRLLEHPRLAVRELAHWHLTRLAPLERPIAYDPTGPAADRTKAARQWREVIPAGELPPHLRDKK